jgi:hypothetical protein
MENAAPVVRQQQEYVQDVEPGGRHAEEVDGDQALDVVFEERALGL